MAPIDHMSSHFGRVCSDELSDKSDLSQIGRLQVFRQPAGEDPG